MYGRHTHVLSCLVMSNSLRPHGLYSTRLLCLWGFFRQEYWSELPFPSLGESFQPGIEPRFPTLQMDSLPSEPTRKPPGKNHQRRQTDRQTDRHTYMMEYYNEILSFATTWMHLDLSLVKQIRQRKTNTVFSLTCKI